MVFWLPMLPIPMLRSLLPLLPIPMLRSLLPLLPTDRFRRGLGQGQLQRGAARGAGARRAEARGEGGEPPRLREVSELPEEPAPLLWCILPRAVRTLTKPPKVKLLAGEQKATEFGIFSREVPQKKRGVKKEQQRKYPGNLSTLFPLHPPQQKKKKKERRRNPDLVASPAMRFLCFLFFGFLVSRGDFHLTH